MLIIVGGVKSTTPITQIIKPPYHKVDIITKYPETCFKINQQLVQNTVSFVDDPIVLAKSYGAYICGSVKIPNLISFSLPLKNKNIWFPFPNKAKHKLLIYNKKEFSEYKENLPQIPTLVLAGDHGLQPMNNDKKQRICEKILENIKNERLRYSSRLNLHSLNWKQNAICTIKESPQFRKVYPKLPFVGDLEPITQIVQRNNFKSFFIFQSSILETHKGSPIIKSQIATGGFGISNTKKDAIMGCYYESLERYSYSLGMIDKISLKLSEIPKEVQFPKGEFEFWKQYANTKLDWTVVHSTKGEQKLYPVDLLFPTNILRETCSTGASIHKTFGAALEHGLFEAIERHSLMSWFYGYIPAKKINIHKTKLSKESKKILRQFKEYDIHTYIIDYLGIKTCCILCTNGKDVFLGTSSGRNMIQGALKEIVITSIFIPNLSKITPKKRKDITVLPQHLLYYQGSNKLLDILESLKTSSKITIKQAKNPLKVLNSNKYHIFYKDITAPELREKFVSLKVFVPGFLDLLKKDKPWKKYYGYKGGHKHVIPFA